MSAPIKRATASSNASPTSLLVKLTGLTVFGAFFGMAQICTGQVKFFFEKKSVKQETSRLKLEQAKLFFA